LAAADFSATVGGLTPNGTHWLWSWALAIPNKAKNIAGVRKFVEWATPKDYIKLAAADEGWASVPPGTRKCGLAVC